MSVTLYQIEISSRNGFEIPSEIPTAFGCIITKPSEFPSASKNRRGMRYTDAGFSRDLMHINIIDVPNLPDPVPAMSEVAEITAHIWNKLNHYYGITFSDVNVIVKPS
ncbi:MAG: hypothetical protein ACTHMM_20290 [Agriterribacter sp.]